MSKKKTKYIVKCPYCEKTYIIESVHGEDFCCPTCSGAGTLKDAVKVEEKPEVREVRVSYVGNNKKLKKPDWYGEDKPLPPVEETTLMDHVSSGKGGSNKFSVLFFLICLVIALMRWVASLEPETYGRDGKPLSEAEKQLIEIASNSREANKIKWFLEDMLRALQEEDYNYLIFRTYKGGDTAYRTTEEWKKTIKTSRLGEYLGVEKISIAEMTYVHGKPNLSSILFDYDEYYKNHEESYETFEVHMSDGEKIEITVYRHEDGPWMISWQ